jgi:transcriptional regulator with XRE-family HTH domain
MSTAISEQHSESLSVAVARRLRGQLAERNIKGAELARLTGLPQSTVSRKLLGGTPFTLDELQGICDVTGIDIGFILVGVRGESAPTPPQDGELPPKSDPVSNRKPLDYKVGGSAEDSNITHLPFRRLTGEPPLEIAA